jgi:dGTPase
LLDLIKKVVRRQVYSDRSIESLELAGMAIITSLLDRFGALLDIARDDFAKLLEKGARVKGKDVEKRLVDFVANSHLSAYKAIEGQCTEDVELCHRAHMIVDYISGMTDPFALKMHQVLTGSRL